MIKITKIVVEFFLERMQECILMYFVCDIVSVMDPCTAQQSTWHPGKRDCPLGPAFIRAFAMSFISYIFHEVVMSYKGSERLCFSMFLAWCLIHNQLHKINAISEIVLNIFSNSQSFNLIIINTAFLHHPEINTMAYLRCHISKLIAHTTPKNPHIFRYLQFWFWTKVHMVRCVTKT